MEKRMTIPMLMVLMTGLPVLAQNSCQDKAPDPCHRASRCDDRGIFLPSTSINLGPSAPREYIPDGTVRTNALNVNGVVYEIDGGNGPLTPARPAVQKDPLDEEYRSEIDRLKAEGKWPLKRKISEAQSRVAVIRTQIDRLGELIQEVEGVRDEVNEMKDQNEKRSTSPVKSGKKTAGSTAAKKAGEWAAVRALGAEAGPVGLIAGVVENLLEKAVQEKWKNDTRNSLKDDLKNLGNNISGLQQVTSALYQDLGTELDNLKELEQEKANFEKLENRWAEDRLSKQDQGPASRHANLNRGTDEAGDREEARKASRERAQRGIRSADGTPPPARTPGVTLAN